MSDKEGEKAFEGTHHGEDSIVFGSRIPAESVLVKMRDQSTWRLVFLSVITLGIYEAHYMKRQSIKINALTSPEARISINFANALIVLSYFSAAMMIPYVMLDDHSPVNMISNCLDLIVLGMFLFLSFVMRDHLHYLLASQFRSVHWFGALWTLVFGAFYINFRINKLEDLARSSQS